MASNGRHPTGYGHLTTAGKHIPPLRLRSVGASVTTSLCHRQCGNGRYADDIVIGFDKRYDARRFRIAMQRRLGSSDFHGSPEKTRLMEFSRFAAENRAIRGKGKPETFNFLGFTHISRKDRKRQVHADTKDPPDRMTATQSHQRRSAKALALLNPRTGKWLRRVVQDT